MFEEFKSCGYVGCFLTLTYNDGSVPRVWDKDTGCSYLSVCKKHPQNAIKRFRTAYKRKYGKDVPFRYFLTSEYGPRTCRPHYHMIVFGLLRVDLLQFIQDWQSRYGFVHAKDVKGTCVKVARYVAKYCSKGVFENPHVASGIVLPTFHLMSKGVGRSFVQSSRTNPFFFWKPARKYADVSRKIYSDDYLDFVGFRLRYLLDGYSYHFPRYFKTKIYGSQNDLSRQVEAYVFRERMRVLDEELAKIQADRHCSLSEAYHFMACRDSVESRQREENARLSLERFYDKSKL